MIYTISLNPAVDKTIYVKTMTTEHVNRVLKSYKDPAGKGINVSKVLNSLGVENTILTLLAGEKGKFIHDELSPNHNLIYKEIDGNTRENIKIINQITNETYSINEMGPSITEKHVKDLLDKITIKEEDIVVLSGSLSPSIPNTIYKEIIEKISNKGAFVLLDTSGDLLIEGIKSCPNVIKPNKEELEHLLGKTYNSPEDVINDKEEILALGVDRVIVTLGEQGSVYISPRNTYYVEGLNVDELSNVGSGDAFVSGYIYGISRGLTTVESLKWASAVSTASVATVSTVPGTLKRVEEFYERVSIHEVE